MSDNQFVFDSGDVVETFVVEVDHVYAEPGQPHPDQPHEFHEVHYRAGGVDPDFVACQCGRMAFVPRPVVAAS